MKEILAIARALSDAGRLRALMALAAGELCVCQLIELLELAPSTVSKHISILSQAGLVESRKDGRWVYYRLAEAPAESCGGQALAMIRRCLARDERVRQDARRLRAIRKTALRDLCACYGR